MSKRGSTKDWTRQRWQKETLRDFQKAIRYEAINPTIEPGDRVQCVTCQRYYGVKQMQGGHFIPRKHNATCFEEMNVHPQCVKCNHFLSGNLAEFERFMCTAYGLEAVDALKAKSREIKTWTIAELKQMRTKYRDRWKAAKQTHGIS